MAINFPTATIVGQEYTDDTRVIWEVTHLTPTRWKRKVITTTSGSPNDGTVGQVLTKQSSADFDTYWTSITPGQPAGGVTSDILTKQSGTNYDSDWQAAPLELPVGGVNDQVLSKIDGTDYNVQWVTDAGGLPGTTNAIFLQATAPTGWVIDITSTDRMMRVNSAAGGTQAGTDNPVLNDKVMTHDHTATASASGGTHTHGPLGGGAFIVTGGVQSAKGALGGVSRQLQNLTGAAGPHLHASAVDAGGQGNWTPLYVNVLHCAKD